MLMARKYEYLIPRAGKVDEHFGGGLRPFSIEIDEHIIENQRHLNSAPGVASDQGESEAQGSCSRVPRRAFPRGERSSASSTNKTSSARGVQMRVYLPLVIWARYCDASFKVSG